MKPCGLRGATIWNPGSGQLAPKLSSELRRRAPRCYIGRRQGASSPETASAPHGDHHDSAGRPASELHESIGSETSFKHRAAARSGRSPRLIRGLQSAIFAVAGGGWIDRRSAPTATATKRSSPPRRHHLRMPGDGEDVGTTAEPLGTGLAPVRRTITGDRRLHRIAYEPDPAKGGLGDQGWDGHAHPVARCHRDRCRGLSATRQRFHAVADWRVAHTRISRP